MKKFEGVEVFQPNGTGQGGGASLPFNKGFYQSGSCNGAPGIQFTPSGEQNFKAYKNMKHSKKNIRRKMKKFNQFIKENINELDGDIEVIDFQFYDPFDGNMRIKINGKNKPEHFKIYDYGNIAFDRFYSEENYNKLVNFIYNQLEDGKLKDNVESYYEDILDEIQDSYELTEDACTTLGNSGGMGNVVSAQPSSTPGDVAGGTKGSGDIGQTLGTYTKPMLNLKKRKKKKKYEGMEHIELFEDFKDKVTYEMSGPPTPYWSYKQEFVDDMKNWGYTHTSLTKNTDMLIVQHKDLNTLKCQKAEKYGIPIYTYKEAFDKKERLYKRVVRGNKIKNIEKNREE